MPTRKEAMELDPLVYGTTTRPFAQLSSVPTPKPSSDNEEVPPNAPPPTPVPHVVSLSPLTPNALKRAPVYATSSYRGAGLAELSLKEQNDIKEHSDILSNVQKIRSEHKMSAKSRKRTYASTETTENIDALCANAAEKAIPCICLCKPHELTQDTVSTWNRFCGTQESEAISLLHSFAGTASASVSLFGVSGFELNGDLKEEGYYSKGKRIGKWEFYIGGKKASKKEIKEGQKFNKTSINKN